MTQEEQRNLQILESRVRRMMELVQRQDEKIRSLIAQKENLQRIVEEKEGQIESLRQENVTLTSGKGLISNSNSLGNAQRRVNEMIHSIDRCIKLLEIR